MKICVFGAGAVGGNLAARLAQDARNRVCVVARGPSLEAIRRNGITVETGGLRLTQRVTASDRTADLGIQDLVISTVKATQLADLAGAIGPMLGPDTSVVFAQNGIPWWYLIGAAASDAPSPDLSFLDPGGELARAIPRRSIVGAVVETASSVISPGVILNSSPNHNRLLLANIDDSPGERLEMVRQRLNDASILSPPVPAIRRAIWQKLAANIVTAMTILLEEPTSTMLADSAMRTIAELLVREVASVAAAHGIQIDPVLPNAPVGKKPSILEDYEKRRRMEIDAQLMAPLAFARAAGLPTPILETVVATIAHRAAARGLYEQTGGTSA
jgi:2-dehydropantoate 2-reductase